MGSLAGFGVVDVEYDCADVTAKNNWLHIWAYATDIGKKLWAFFDKPWGAISGAMLGCALGGNSWRKSAKLLFTIQAGGSTQGPQKEKVLETCSPSEASKFFIAWQRHWDVVAAACATCTQVQGLLMYIRYTDNGLSHSYNLCQYSVKRNVTKNLSYQKSFTTFESCGGWHLWKLCPKVTFKTLYPLNRSKEFASHPGMCPTEEKAMGNQTCRWDIDCPGLQKCCNISGESVCISPIPAVGEGYFNLLIEVKQDFEQTEFDLMNHLRFLHSVVTGALDPLNSSMYHIHTQRDGEHKIVSKLLLGTRPPTTLGNISKELQKVLINVAEVSHLETEDINECEYAELNSCSLRATCLNTDGSHNCSCQNGFTDKDPSRRDRDCRALSPVTNLAIANVTSISFQVLWAAASSKDQTVIVRVLKEDGIVNEIETQQIDLMVTGLEPGVLYTVEVHWQSCEDRHTKELKVKTAALLLDGRARIKNYNFTESLGNTSSSEFKQFAKLWYQELENSLPPTIHQLYQSRKILVRIASLSYGSIVVNFEIVIDQGIKLNVWNISSALISSLYNSSAFVYDRNGTSISDVNECTSPIYNDCSPHAMCKNTEGSYICICSDRYKDVNPARPGRSCEVSWYRRRIVVSYSTEGGLSALQAFASPLKVIQSHYDCANSYKYPRTIFYCLCLCNDHLSSSPVINLTVFKVTSASFQVTWTTEINQEQTFIVQLLKNDSIVNKTETMELEWTVSDLEPETEYTVSVTSRACEDEGPAAELSVKTDTIYTGPASTLNSIQSSTRFTSTVAIYLNSSRFAPGFPYADILPCSAPSPVINLTVSNVTTTSFHLTWTTDAYEEQLFIAQVLKNYIIVNETETMELEWTVSDLEPECVYTVSVFSRACEDEGPAAELSVKTEIIMNALSYTSSPRQSSTGVVSTMTIYPNTSGFPIAFAYAEVPPCSTPLPIINLTVFNVTSKSFHITWTTDNYEEQIFIVQLLQNDSVVKETETLELALTVSGLEPGTEYAVSVTSRSCEQEGTATELIVKTAETMGTRRKQSVVGFVSSMTIYLNRPGFPDNVPHSDLPPCSPSFVTNLAASSVTSSGFRVTWTTDTSEEQSFVVQVLKNDSIVSVTETQEMEWTARGLEPGTEYIVSVMSRVCEQESIATELTVKTALSPSKAEKRMAIPNADYQRSSIALDQFAPNSVQTFTPFSTQTSTLACVPPPIRSLIAFNVTSNSLGMIWEADDTIHREFVVQLLKDNSILVDAKTKELSWTVSDLEAGVLYTVRVISQLCGKEGKAKVQEVKTAAHIMGGRTRITNLMFSEGLRNSSSDKFKNFTAQFITQILKFLPEYTTELLSSGKVKVVIRSLWEGSVNVDFQLIFDEAITANVSEIIVDLVTSLKDSSVFSFDPDSTDISEKSADWLASRLWLRRCLENVPENYYPPQFLFNSEKAQCWTCSFCLQYYNECASLDDNDCSLKAKCINTEGSYTCSCLDDFVDINPARPGRNCREPMVASPTTVEAASQSITISCKLHEISVIMERSFLEEKKIPASSLYLGNSQCNGSIGNLTHVALKVGWTECGTQISNNATHTVVITTLRNIPSSSAVPTSANLKVPVNCTFDNSLLLTAGYTPNRMNGISLEGIENYVASIETISASYTQSEDPVLTPEDDVSVQVSIDTSDSRARLILAECWATPSKNSTSNTSHSIIKTGCPVPGSQTRISENGNSTKANFSVKVFSFINMSIVYIHCQARVCLEVNRASCQPLCSGSHAVKSAEVVAERTVSLGPLYRKYNNDGEPMVELDENASATKAVIGLGILLCLTLVVISAVVVTIYTRWGRSFIAQSNGQNYQAFDNY
ncbi:uromodulin-like 1 [Carcharodon carcharias]|uniref:uromodulin-like 1 n=1 Tax=Carcharodon carcharias TaxID=13397 RepID=UPI001B7EA720|nr:uromodulin-like 1 [Carcharodon carcharias]